jgi:tRNA(Arg) A34 adenosine deaminase TadA
MEEHRQFMKEAIDMARENVHRINGGPFGAVVVKNGRIVGRGVNQVTTNMDPTAHAEVVAIREACQALNTYNLEGCEIYSSCEPCPMCLGSIYWARIRKLYYAATKEDAAKAEFRDALIYKEFDLPKDERSIPTMQLMHTEAVKLFEEWKASDHKIDY